MDNLKDKYTEEARAAFLPQLESGKITEDGYAIAVRERVASYLAYDLYEKSVGI